MRRLKAPLKAQGITPKKTSGTPSSPRGSRSRPAEAARNACKNTQGASDNGDAEHGGNLDADKAQQDELHQIQAAVAKRARFESVRANLGNFERAYPVEVETVNISPLRAKVCYKHVSKVMVMFKKIFNATCKSKLTIHYSYST